MLVNDQDYDLHVVASTYACRWSKTEIHLTLWIWGLVLSYCENTTDMLIIECGQFFGILIILSKAENLCNYKYMYMLFLSYFST